MLALRRPKICCLLLRESEKTTPKERANPRSHLEPDRRCQGYRTGRGSSNARSGASGERSLNQRRRTHLRKRIEKKYQYVNLIKMKLPYILKYFLHLLLKNLFSFGILAMHYFEVSNKPDLLAF